MNSCIAITKKGSQCKINATKGESLCHLHKQISGNRRILTIFDEVQEIAPKKKNTRIKKKLFADAIVIINDISDTLDDIIENNILIEKKKTTPEPPKTVEEDFMVPFIVDGIYECQCCYTEFPFNDLIKCTKSSEVHKHVFCTSCVSGYINSGLGDKKANVSCMMSSTGCGGQYCIEDIKRCISEKQFSNFGDIADIHEALRMADIFDDFQICPFCSKYGCITDNEIKNVKCLRCQKMWCIKCRKEDHGKDSCGKIKNPEDIEGIKRIVHESITEALTHQCPHCNTKYIKETGCNLMTCDSCGVHSCYICGIILKERPGGIKYYHFKGSGSADPNAVCLLYNDKTGLTKDHGNAMYNNEKLKYSCQKLIDMNDDIKIKRIIYKEAQKLGIKIDIPENIKEKKCIIL
jgi:hypothetical protein